MRDEPLRSLLFVPGSRPDRMNKARGLGADAVILDLEDGVALAEKDRARVEIRSVLENRDFGRSKVCCRVNDWSSGRMLVDLEGIVDRVDAIVLPKVESPEDVLRLVGAIEERLGAAAAGERPWVLALIESPAAVLDARAIGRAHQRVAGLLFGGEDFAASLGVSRTPEGRELATARSLLALGAAAAGVQAIDTIWLDLRDPEGLYRDTVESSQLGFRGRLVIHPSQIEVVHRAFLPSQEQVDWARRVVAAWREALGRGEGVFTVDGKLVDRPVLLQAQRIVQYQDLGVS